MANGVADEDLAKGLYTFAAAAEPVLDVLRQEQAAGEPDGSDACPSRTSRGLRERARAGLSAIDLPGSAVWATLDADARSDWWVKRVGVATAALAASPGLVGGLADKTGIQTAISVAGQGLILCALAREYGLSRHSDQAELIASVLFSRTLPAASGDGGSRGLILGVLEDLQTATKRPPGLVAVGRAMFRLGQQLSAVRQELAKLAESSGKRRFLGKVPIAGAISGFLSERSTLRETARAGREWIAQRRDGGHDVGVVSHAPHLNSGRDNSLSIDRISRPSGRKLRSMLTVDECVDLFRMLWTEHGGRCEYVEPIWLGGAQEAPERLVAACRYGEPELYLAVWNGDHLRDLALVPANDPGQLAPAFIGAWKMRDVSLTSTGTLYSFPVSGR